nr:thiol-disulfide oxidoreductase DCC family protein [uncultured Macellibacteroides sp.]
MGIVLFDGFCNLCNGSVRFIIKRDRSGKFRFASLQSEASKALLSHYEVSDTGTDSIVYIQEQGKVLNQSSAVLHILKDLGHGWQLFFLFIYLPLPLRDAIYLYIARNRYKWFGKKEKCMIPSDSIRSRFIC